MVELGRDLRPPDYAASFVRLALAGSPLDEPIAVCAVIRPEWLVAVANEHGVSNVSLAEALGRLRTDLTGRTPTGGGGPDGRWR